MAEKIRSDWQKFTEQRITNNPNSHDGFIYRKWKTFEDTTKGYVSLVRQFNPVKNEVDYFITEKLVKEKASRESDTVYRLEAFYYLCRNSVVPVAFLIFMLFLGKSSLRRKWIWFVVIFIIIESIILIAALHYFAAKTCAVLAAVALLE